MSNRERMKLSEELGVSRVVVQRALDHCPGVRGDLRDQILAAEQSPREGGCPCDVYVIMPERPEYFWSPLFWRVYEGMTERGISVKYNVYSKLDDISTVETYLKEAEKLGVRCIVIATISGFEERLSSLARDHALFTVCNRVDGPNVFFFGSDHEADGRLLGEKCNELLPNAETFVLIGNNDERRAGILSAIGNKRVFEIPCPLYTTPSFELARALAPIAREHKIDAVIGLDGINAKIAEAAKKCRVEAPLFGFENQRIGERYQKPLVTVSQDLTAIAENLVEATERYVKYRFYPSSKNTYSKSDIIC